MPTFKNYAFLTAAVLATLSTAVPSAASSKNLKVRQDYGGDVGGYDGGDNGGDGGYDGEDNGGDGGYDGEDNGVDNGEYDGGDNGGYDGGDNGGYDGGDNGGYDGGDNGGYDGGNNPGYNTTSYDNSTGYDNGNNGGSGGDSDHIPYYPPQTCGTCNPISGINGCDVTTSCINTGTNFHCACRAGYKAGNGNDFRIRMPDFEFLVFVPEGQTCDALCDNPYGFGPDLCKEVPLLPTAACPP